MDEYETRCLTAEQLAELRQQLEDDENCLACSRAQSRMKYYRDLTDKQAVSDSYYADICKAG